MNMTWIDVLQEKAELFADRTAYHYLLTGSIDGLSKSLSYTTLAQRSAAIGAALVERGACGERVLIAYPTGPAFIESFFGALYAGAVPVPVRPPEMGGLQEFITRVTYICTDVDARFVLASNEIQEQCKSQAELPDLNWIDSTEIPMELSSNWRHPGSRAEDLAFIQYTSGSTRQPHGVCISHANLSANCLALGKADFYREGETHVSWMPHYHDMGLVGSLLASLYGGVTSVIMSPQNFVRRPLRWLQAIDHFSASSSGGPNFAYSLAVQRTTEKERAALDLCSWQVAYCGAEPIRDGVLKDFSNAFKVSGFNEQSFFPCYGMAEATLFVTGRHGRRSLPAEQQPQTGNSTKQALVSLGNPYDDTEIAIVEPATKQRLRDQQIGEIWVRGPSVSSGYYRSDETDNQFDNKLEGKSGFYCSGDMGFLHDGELFVCGRQKDLIIVRGQNIYPQDIELVAESVSSMLLPNSIAAFSHDSKTDEDTERFVVVVGLRAKTLSTDSLEALAVKIKTAIVKSFDVCPEVIAVVNVREIPKTSSGKIRRSACRDKLQQKQFTVLAEIGGKTDINTTVLYENLNKYTAKLDKRNTKYQFDLEKDIEWARVNEKGRYFSDEFLRHQWINVDALKSDPQALEYHEWALALFICDKFASLEETVLEWSDRVSKVKAETRSLELLEMEEVKHIALFRRYADKLAAMHPDKAEAVREIWVQSENDFHSVFKQRQQYETDLHYHYSIWLGILHFEEFTLWIDESLKDVGDDLQVTWKQAHYCHRREETQHVLTDLAYIQALEASFEQRQLWSMDFFNQAFGIYAREYSDLIALTEERFPHLRGCLSIPQDKWKEKFTDLFSHRLFSRSRSIAPYIDSQIEKQKQNSSTVHHLPEENELRDSLQDILSRLLKCKKQEIALDEGFDALGLDSLGHLSLAAELEQCFGYQVTGEIIHRHTSINALTDYLIGSRESLMTQQHTHPATETSVHESQAANSSQALEKDVARHTALNLNRKNAPLFWINGRPEIFSIFNKFFPRNRSFYYLHHQGGDGKPAKYTSIPDIARYYVNTILNLNSSGPYYIGGYSVGGAIAYEVSQQLEEMGKEVIKLFLISPVGLGYMGADKNMLIARHHSRLLKLTWGDKLRYFLKKIVRIPYYFSKKVKPKIRKYICKICFLAGRPLPRHLFFDYIFSIYHNAIKQYHPTPYSGDIFILHEKNKGISEWSDLIEGESVVLPPIDCKHEEFFKKKYAAQWIPELVRSLKD